MKTITYIENLHQLQQAKEYGFSEVVLGHIELSRFGKLDTNAFKELSKVAKELGLKVLLEWDVLMTENQFKTKAIIATDLKDFVDSYRVQDAGAMNYIFENTSLPMQLILENGNHNLKGVQNWISLFEGRVEKVVISIEMARESLKHFCENLSVPVELLVLGRILLFYTPRNLLSNLIKDEKHQLVSNDFIEAVGESEESPHKGFPIIENRHGTFMFHIRNFFLLDYLEDLKSIGISFARVDLRFDNDFDQVANVMNVFNQSYSAIDFKKEYGHDVIRGFYHVNKSDVLFKKLKNHRIQRKDNSYVGDVVDVEKSSHMAIMVRSDVDLKVGDELKFITPEGKEFTCNIHFLNNTKGEPLENVSNGQLVLMNQFKGIWTKSSVYLNI